MGRLQSTMTPLLEHAIRIDRESLLRIRHNLIAAPGVALEDVWHVISHPVALSQCRRYVGAMQHAQARCRSTTPPAA